MRTPMLTRRGGDMGGKSIISNSYLEDIGDAIRYKKSTSETFYPSQMGDAIRSIEGIVPVGSIEIDTNGVYDVTEKAEVDVDVNPDLRPLSVNENGTYEPDGFDGYSDVTVDVEPNLTSLNVTENGLYLPESGVDGFDRVSVDVPTLNLNEIADQSAIYGDVVLGSATKIRDYFFTGANVSSVVAPLATKIGNFAFNSSTLLSGKFASCTDVGEEAFRNLSSFGANSNFIDDFPNIESTALYSFGSCGFVDIIIPASYKGSTRNYSFAGCTKLKRVRFLGTPTTLMNGAFGVNNRLTDIYVPWSEGEVANAPWGASRATIHYNTVYDSEWNVISST